MASFDPSIISQIPDMAPNPMAAKGQALTLAGMMDKEQLGRLQLREAQRSEADQLAVKNILSKEKIDYSSPEGVAKTAEKISRVSPEMGMKFMKTAQDYQTGAIQQKLAALQLADEQQGSIVSALDPVVAQLEKMEKAGATPAALNAASKALFKPALENLMEARPDLKPMMAKFGGADVNYQQLKSWEASSKRGQEMIKLRQAQYKQEDQERKTDIAQQRANTYQQNELSLEKRRLQLEEDAKLPTNHRWADKEHTKMEPIPGSPADPKSPNYKPPSGGGATGREMIFFKRVQGAGNELSTSLGNIMELPMGVSSGLLGYGGSPGESLFKSTGNALKNKMTSQDVQSYMSMMPGVAKSLASIDAQGLQSSQGLQNMMDKLSLKEGDTNMTKLRKMADMRQIAEKGLEIWTANPRIPQEEKELTSTILEQIRSAVPFTQHDITAYQRSLKKNPSMTLAEFAQSKGIGSAPRAKTTSELPPGFTLDK